MKYELDRIKKDVETIQNAIGLAPSFQREWLQWMKRDKWFCLWWCLPGVIILASALFPFDRATKYFGLVPDQWGGILVALSLIGIAIGHSRRVAGKDGRPEEMVRESKRLYGLSSQGTWFGLGIAAQILLYFVWGKQHHIAFEPFWTGLFVLFGSTCLVGAFLSRGWVLLGYAIPFISYGLCLPLAGENREVKSVLFGLMFIAIALSFSLIQVLEIRNVEQQAAA
jgi:hypothetical protein